LIQAKPVDRRRVLEDAAAISGLHNRRKEAETKLRAAEKNLTRVDDLLGQKSGVYEQLVKQAKQAERYKVLADTIRRLEALSLVMEYTRVTQEIEAAQASMVVANEAQNQAKQALYDVSKQRDGLQSRWDAVDRAINEQRQKMQNVQRDKDIAQAELQRLRRSAQI
jgi:chromosome segregation protein